MSASGQGRLGSPRKVGRHRRERPPRGVIWTRVRLALAVARHRSLRRFWFSQMVNEVGDWVGLLGISALLYQRTGQAVVAGAALAVLYLPYLFSPWLAALGARIPARTLLIGADVLRGLLVLLLLLPMPPWALLVVVFLSGVPNSIYEATLAAAVPEYAPDDHTRDDALVLFQSTQQVAVMVGFLAGGAALGFFGVEAAIILNSASFLISAALLLGVPPIPAFAEAGESAMRMVRSGIRALRGHTLLRRAILLAIVSASTMMAGEALAVVFGEAIHHQGLAGPLAATSALVGAVLALVLPRHGTSKDLMRTIEVTMVIGVAVTIGGFILSTNVWLGLIGYIGLGIINAPGALLYVVAVREMTAAVRPPVFALTQVAFMGGQAFVAVAAGQTADVLDVGTAIALWQIPTLLLSVWWLVVTAGSRRARVEQPPVAFPQRPQPRAEAPDGSVTVDAPGTPGLPTTP